MNELFQLLPPLIEYSTSAPASTPVTLSVPTLVLWSLPETPLSIVNATVGAPGAIVSFVAVWPVPVAVLPAVSVVEIDAVMGRQSARTDQPC